MSDAVLVAAIAAIPSTLALWLNYKQGQKTQAKVTEVHDYVQGNYHTLAGEKNALQKDLDDERALALSKAEHKED